MVLLFPAILYGILYGPASVRAQDPSNAWVQVQVAGDEDTHAAVVAEFSAVLAPAGLDVHGERQLRIELDEVLEDPPPPMPRARVFVDLTDRTRPLLMIADDARGRLSIRRITTPAAEDILVEQLAQIVSSALGAILAGAEFGEDREQARRTLRGSTEPEEPEVTESHPPPVSAPVDEGTLRVSAYVGYDGGLREGGPEFFHGPRLGAAVEPWTGPFRLEVFGDVAYRFGPGIERDGVLEGRVDAVALRAGVGVTYGNSDRRVGLRVAGGVDIGLPFLSVEEPFSDIGDVTTDPTLRTALRGELSLAPDIGVYLELGLEIYPVDVELKVRNRGTEETLAAPHRFQPFVGVGLQIF